MNAYRHFYIQQLTTTTTTTSTTSSSSSFPAIPPSQRNSIWRVNSSRKVTSRLSTKISSCLHHLQPYASSCSSSSSSSSCSSPATHLSQTSQGHRKANTKSPGVKSVPLFNPSPPLPVFLHFSLASL
ncbi:hypothetical protein E2C01_065092 [Portunus trituberculatus]|uniref:Uncharacterized protein n=1 Tax=Portunus trituberculatus TaxID=210409 RepID=A0A5B7HDJ9_PORTR|nr:hypothetical protein [Portunus trituberculatus]